MAAIYKRHRLLRTKTLTSPIDDVTPPSIYDNNFDFKLPKENASVEEFNSDGFHKKQNEVKYKETSFFDGFEMDDLEPEVKINSDDKLATLKDSSPDHLKSAKVVGSFSFIDSNWEASLEEDSDVFSQNTEDLQSYQVHVKINDKRIILAVDVVESVLEFSSTDTELNENEISSNDSPTNSPKLDLNEMDDLITTIKEECDNIEEKKETGYGLRTRRTLKSGGFYPSDMIYDMSSGSEDEYDNEQYDLEIAEKCEFDDISNTPVIELTKTKKLEDRNLFESYKSSESESEDFKKIDRSKLKLVLRRKQATGDKVKNSSDAVLSKKLESEINKNKTTSRPKSKLNSTSSGFNDFELKPTHKKVNKNCSRGNKTDSRTRLYNNVDDAPEPKTLQCKTQSNISSQPLGSDNDVLKRKSNNNETVTMSNVEAMDLSVIPSAQIKLNLKEKEKKKGRKKKERSKERYARDINSPVDTKGTEIRLAMEFPKHNWLAKHLEEKIQDEESDTNTKKREDISKLKSFVTITKENVIPAKTGVTEKNSDNSFSEEIQKPVTLKNTPKSTEDRSSFSPALSSISLKTVHSTINEGSHMVGIVKPFQYSINVKNKEKKEPLHKETSDLVSEKKINTEEKSIKPGKLSNTLTSHLPVKIDAYFSLAKNKSNPDSPLDLSTTKQVVTATDSVLDLSSKSKSQSSATNIIKLLSTDKKKRTDFKEILVKPKTLPLNDTKTKTVQTNKPKEAVQRQNKHVENPRGQQPSLLQDFRRKRNEALNKKTGRLWKETFCLAPPSSVVTSTRTANKSDANAINNTSPKCSTKNTQVKVTEIIDVDALEDKSPSRHRINGFSPKSGNFHSIKSTVRPNKPQSFSTLPIAQLPTEFIQLQSGRQNRHGTSMYTNAEHRSSLTKMLTSDATAPVPDNYVINKLKLRQHPDQEYGFTSAGRSYSHISQRVSSNDSRAQDFVKVIDPRVVKSADPYNVYQKYNNSTQTHKLSQITQPRSRNSLYYQANPLRQYPRSSNPISTNKMNNAELENLHSHIIKRNLSLNPLTHNTNAVGGQKQYAPRPNIVRAPPGGVAINSTPISSHVNTFNSLPRRADVPLSREINHPLYKNYNVVGGNGDMRYVQQSMRRAPSNRAIADNMRGSFVNYKEMKRKLSPLDPRESAYIADHNPMLMQSIAPPIAKSRRVAHQKQGPVNKDERCTVCLKKAYFVCSGCKLNWYCSKQCQFQDWINHSKVCL